MIAGCTTYKLSFLENDTKSLTPTLNYTPIRTYRPSDVPMKAETIMQLSYQPVESGDKVEKPWSEKPTYQFPVTPMEDNTTYNMRFSISYKLIIISDQTVINYFNCINFQKYKK